MIRFMLPLFTVLLSARLVGYTTIDRHVCLTLVQSPSLCSFDK